MQHIQLTYIQHHILQKIKNEWSWLDYFIQDSIPRTRQNGNSEQTAENSDSKADQSGGGGGHGIQTDHPTSYIETMMHLFKGNVGPGLFAMGDAFKNSGILVGPILTLLLGLICVHSQHILVHFFK